MNSETEKQVVELLRQQQILNISLTACIMDLVDVLPIGERRGRYLDKIDPLLENVKSFNEHYLRLRGAIAGEVQDDA